MPSIFASLFVLALLSATSQGRVAKSNFKPVDDEDAYLSVVQLITKYGYPVEEHFVTTSDGYILRMHRIPHGKDSTTVSDTPIFIQHGLLCSSADWVVTGPEHALGYILADAGYDVWLGNGRGNHESRNHTYLDPDWNSEFWQFSWHEIGTIDIPTMVDHVLSVTAKSQLYHIGHSEGTTTYYVMASMRPEYNAKIKAHFSLAPSAYMSHMTSPLMHIMAFWSGSLDLLWSMIGVNEFLPNNVFMGMAADVLCGDDDITQILCTNSLFAICGYSPEEMNATMLPVLTGHTPAGTSVMQMMHYCQEINSGTFRQYDWGLENFIKYGSFTPPPYPIDRISSPMYFFYSHNDWIASEPDVMKFAGELGNTVVEKILVADGLFNHLDYMYGIRAPEIVYSKIISLMKELDG